MIITYINSYATESRKIDSEGKTKIIRGVENSSH